MRLLLFLGDEVARRRTLGPALLAEEPDILVAIDSYGPFMAEFDDGADRAIIESFVQVVSSGAEVGVRLLLAADRGGAVAPAVAATIRSDENTSELQSLMRRSYAVFCLNNKTYNSTYSDNAISL